MRYCHVSSLARPSFKSSLAVFALGRLRDTEIEKEKLHIWMNYFFNFGRPLTQKQQTDRGRREIETRPLLSKVIPFKIPYRREAVILRASWHLATGKIGLGCGKHVTTGTDGWAVTMTTHTHGREKSRYYKSSSMNGYNEVIKFCFTSFEFHISKPHRFVVREGDEVQL